MPDDGLSELFCWRLRKWVLALFSLIFTLLYFPVLLATKLTLGMKDMGHQPSKTSSVPLLLRRPNWDNTATYPRNFSTVHP